MTPEEWQMPLVVTPEAEQAVKEGRVPEFEVVPDEGEEKK